jgi:uncharacterized Zn finger protein (UPF0148 family)
MGGHDNYCAICGTPVSQPIWDDEDNNNTAEEDDENDNNTDEEDDENDNNTDEEDDEYDNNTAEEDDENDDDAAEEDDEYEYDRSILSVRDVLWMNDVRLICENNEATSINK